MSGKRVVRLGDPTTHGGTVVSATVGYVMFGKEVAGRGDTAKCPIRGHGVVTIVEGDPSWTINGKNVALEGHKCSCGCSLISTLPNVGRSYEAAGEAGVGSVPETGAPANSMRYGEQTAHRAADEDGYDQHFLLTDEVTGEPLANRFYRMIWDGKTIEDYTDSEGLTQRVTAESALEVKIEIYPEGYEVGA